MSETAGFAHRPEITFDAAQRLMAASCAEASHRGLTISVAVVDRAGEVVASGRMDAAALGTMRLAIDKAYTAAVWQLPSGDLHESSQPGGADWGLTSTEGGRIVVYAGGLPIFADGTFAGAIGVSGGTGAEDAECAAAALRAVGL